MPGTPKPIVDPRMGSHWTAIMAAIQRNGQQASNLNAGSTQGQIVDSYGNVIELYGSDLAQQVTIGASQGVAGVQVTTGLANGIAGRAVQSGPATTTITLTKGSTAATVGAVAGLLSMGQVIGAANVSDPSTGTPTPAIVPGTTIAVVSGTSVTLSQGAAESGTGLYCATARFVLEQDTGWQPMSLPTNWNPVVSNYVPAWRRIGDLVFLRGEMQNNTGGTTTCNIVLPAAATPTATVQLPLTLNGAFWKVDTSGNLTSNATIVTTGVFFVDGLSYSVI